MGSKVCATGRRMIRQESIVLNGIPEIIRGAGEGAVASYVAFCENAGLTPGTRELYTIMGPTP